jgi:hypothetical protein
MAIVTYSWNPDFDFFNKVINTTTAGNQGAPDVAALANVGGGTGSVNNVHINATPATAAMSAAARSPPRAPRPRRARAPIF